MIRKATAQDASRIAEILIFSKRMAYGDIFNNYKISFGEMQVLPLALAYIENPKLLKDTFVYEDEIIKGMITLSKKEKSDYVEIQELYVDPFFQNHNIGSKMIEFVQLYARQADVLNIVLWVLEKNFAARRFYEKNGFICTKNKKPEEGTTEYSISYHKSLSSLYTN